MNENWNAALNRVLAPIQSHIIILNNAWYVSH